MQRHQQRCLHETAVAAELAAGSSAVLAELDRAGLEGVVLVGRRPDILQVNASL